MTRLIPIAAIVLCLAGVADAFLNDAKAVEKAAELVVDSAETLKKWVFDIIPLG